MDKTLAELAHEVEAAFVLGDDLADRVMDEIQKHSDDLEIGRGQLESTDSVLALIYAIRPGLTLSMEGIARLPNGHWRCSLRRSATRDDDAYLGIGRGPTLPHALLAALLNALAFAS
ncbi:hypothetical protein [Thalassovita aquimarina]|uniref:hypothetical protein n=1 Tax=Thalassovita aquimarina TaxID=2785917 RepID=UPI003569A22B